MTASVPRPPTEIRLSADRTRLTLVWADGARQEIRAALLRARSEAAGAKRARLDGRPPAVSEDITVTDLRLVGRYGLNLVFCDGHDRGIYPWGFLKEIGGTMACPDSGDHAPANAIP